MSGPDLLFYLFATLSVGGGLLMVLSRHPVSAALFMIVSLVGVASFSFFSMPFSWPSCKFWSMRAR